MSDAHSGKGAIIAAASANLGIAATKFGAWVLTGSSSMLAESVHSAADTGNQVLLLWGRRRSEQAPDADHPFGYGQARFLYAFLVSIVLFSMGGLFALYEAWHKFSHPEAIESWHWVPVAVLVVGILLESFSLRTALKEARAAREHLSAVSASAHSLQPNAPRLISLREYIRTSRAPEIPVVLLEDIAALTGLVIALFGVSMTLLTEDGRWDAIGSGAIGVLLIIVAGFLARETASMLLGESMAPGDEQVLRRALSEAGADLIHLKTLHLGPDEVLVAAKAAFPVVNTVSELAAQIDRAEAAARAALPHVKLQMYLETDLRR